MSYVQKVIDKPRAKSRYLTYLETEQIVKKLRELLVPKRGDEQFVEYINGWTDTKVLDSFADTIPGLNVGHIRATREHVIGKMKWARLPEEIRAARVARMKAERYDSGRSDLVVGKLSELEDQIDRLHDRLATSENTIQVLNDKIDRVEKQPVLADVGASNDISVLRSVLRSICKHLESSPSASFHLMKHAGTHIEAQLFKAFMQRE